MTTPAEAPTPRTSELQLYRQFVLHALRNSWGIAEDTLRQVRLDAADSIESLERELSAAIERERLANMRADQAEEARDAAQSATAPHWAGAAAEAHRDMVLRLEDPSGNPDGGAHLLQMIDTIKAGMSPTKACRWLGYIQGVLCARGAATLDELKEINRIASRSAWEGER